MQGGPRASGQMGRPRWVEVGMPIHESGQMYLEAIYMLSRSSSFVRAIDVGEHLGYSKPSVSRALAILRRDGYIQVGSDGAIMLTDVGAEIARTMYTRHTVLSEVFMRLGVDEKTATEDACRIEHVISEETFIAIRRHMERGLLADRGGGEPA